MQNETAGTSWSRWRWWMVVPIAVVVFALAYGITKLVQDDGSNKTEPAPVTGITFAQGHSTPLGITETELRRRITVQPARIQRKATHPPQTCRFYPLTDQSGQYVFCFARGRLVVAYGGPNQ
jgi:hypothetical protein